MLGIVGGLAVGSEFGHLRIERELGRGGFATVYLARDKQLGRQVALKALASSRLHGTASGKLESFLAEARIIAGLQNAHVVTLFQLHEWPSTADDGAPLLVLEMEYVNGGTLGELTASGGLPPEGVEACLRGVLQGLRAAHENGVLHRDIKPANILLTDRGEAKLTDFGLARMIGDEIDLDDGAMGTPLYMAPELLVGDSASERSDLWSFGVVAYELLAGRLPFAAGNAASFFARMQNEDPPVLPPLVPSHLKNAVYRCLAKQPDQRPSSCAAVLALLDGTTERVDPALPQPTPARPTLHSLRGREAELRQLDEAIGAGSGEPNTVVLVGDAGIGKTALCAAAATHARERGIFWIGARLSRVEGPLTTLIEAARLTLLSGEDPATTGFGPGGSHIKQVLRGEELPALDSPQQARSTLQRLLSGIAMTRPLALCVEDAQHASEEDVALLADLARGFSDHPFTLIVASRPDAPATAAFAEARRIELAGLDRESLFQLLADRSEAALPARVVVHVSRQTEGNPLHALELVRHLEETGALVRTEGRLEPAERWRDATVPARLRDVVHSRVASLEESERALLDVAAVDGREFDGRAVASVLGLPMLQILRQLQQLCRDRTLIEAAVQGYRFADMPTQEVLYDDMATELRTELHRALAQHLEERAEDVDPARVARHWERCGDRARAAPYLLCVAKRAENRQEVRRFVDLAERAGMLEDPPRVDLCQEVGTTLRLAAALGSRGRAEESEALYSKLLQLAEEAGDETLYTQVEVTYAINSIRRGKRLDHDADYWSACAERLGETEAGADARTVVGRIAKFEGDLDAARSAFEAADAIYVALGIDWDHSVMRDQLGAVAMRANSLEDARALFSEAADVAERIGGTTNAAVSRTNAALAAMLAGQVDGADRELARSIRIFELAGNVVTAAHTRIYLAEALFALGNTSEALDAVEAALPVLEKGDQRVALANALRLRAEFRAVLGNLHGAVRSIARGLDYASGAKDQRQLIVAHAADAMIATADGRPDDAARAIERIRATGPLDSAQADGAVLMLCEAVLFGLPRSALEAVGALARNEHERLLRDATLAHAEGASCDAILAELEAQTIGLRAASYRLLTNWLAFEQARRSGNTDEANKRVTAAIETATTLGHTRAEAILQLARAPANP